ncbi:MAG: hypothetical protein K2K86_06910, partial [Muribaculaceae bacterium]|nr:hypothetical protein [Muribaculaceae bacterium]
MVARVFAAMLMTAAVVSPAAAQRKKTNFDGATTSGFNAMDYRLQKPLGNPTFPEDKKGFGKNFFLGFNAGGVLIGNNFSGKLNGGGTLGIRMGSWFTPVHGIRIGADAGKNTLGKDLGNTWFKGLHAEYLLNVTNLMRGYNPERRFELIGTLGAQLQRNKYNDIWGTNYGISTSLQARFNVQPSMYLYVEPQLAVLGGAKYNSPETVNRFHANLALNVGIGYKILTGRERIKGARIFEQKDDDNMFFGLGGGLFGVLNLNPKIKNSHVRAFGGKMFSSTSGLQFAIDHSYYTTGTYQNDCGPYNQHIIMGSVNYDLNLNNAFGGYRPTDVFQMILNVGPTVATVTGVAPHKFHFGVQAGLMGLFRLSSNWGIYVHPQ